MTATQDEIEQAYVAVEKAEWDLCRAKLRLRALQGDALMRTGDSFPMAAISAVMTELEKEFGARNLRIF